MVMLKYTPKLPYAGLTIVLSNPSRLDKYELLSGNAGTFVNNLCLQPEFNRYQCEIRLSEDRSQLLPNTKCVLLCGEKAMADWLGDSNTKGNSLGELRGSPFVINGVPHIATYFPQDCVDLKNYEAQYNAQSNGSEGEETYESDDEDEDTGGEKRRHGFTKRKNYGYWFRNDVRKCKYILKHGLPTYEEPTYVTYPSVDDCCNRLESIKGRNFYFDMENDTEFNVLCFSFSFDTKLIYCVPCLLPDYSHAYSQLYRIYKSLAVCVRDNCTVAHNGANHDFHILARKYHIPISKNVYDTMIAEHRISPETEKSLGHSISKHTWLRFHKDMGDVPYNNLENAKRTWQYCGLDVYSMALVHEAQLKYAARHPGLLESIQQGNDAIRPYLITSLMGIRYNPDEVAENIQTNDRLMRQYLRWLDILIGVDNLKSIRGKGKSSLLTSNPQCVKYFHDICGYPEVGKGKERKDGTKGPSLGKKNMFKLRLKHSNPVIDIALAFRELQKETSTLQFKPFKL